MALLCKLDSSWFQGSDTSSGYFQSQGLSVRLQREITEPGSCVRVRPCWVVQIRPSPHYFNSRSGDMVTIPHRQPFRIGHLGTPVLGLSHHGDSDIRPLKLLFLPSAADYLHMSSIEHPEKHVPSVAQPPGPPEVPLWGRCSHTSTPGLWVAQQGLPWSICVTG